MRYRIAAALCAVLAASALAAATEDETGTARITYVTASSVYVDAGTDAGLRPGHRLEVVRDGEVIAVLELVDVTSRRASCRVVDSTAVPAVGDTVRFVPARAEPETDVPGTDAPPVRRRASGPGVRGRVGMSYLLVGDRVTDTGYSQPALDLRLDGRSLAGSPWGFDVDARARRTYRDLSDGTSDNEDRTRVYRLAVERRGTTDPWSFTVGRQYSPALAAVSIFDGFSVERLRPAWRAGMFAGTQPDAGDFGYSDRIREYGVYAGFNGRGSARHRWEVSTAVIGSYDDGEVDREFVYLQGRYGGPSLSVYVAEEIDFNRDWKKEEGADSVELTASFVSVRWEATERVGFRAGFDNRRNVRLVRDRVTPITEFDDAFRDGVWAGIFLRPARRFRIGLDARTASGGAAGDSDAATLTFAANGLTRRNLGFHGRTTRYTNERGEGFLHALAVGFGPTRDVYVQVHGGRRDEDDALGLSDGALTWFGIDVDVTLGRHWYVLLSAERSQGDVEQDNQLYTTLSYRF